MKSKAIIGTIAALALASAWWCAAWGQETPATQPTTLPASPAGGPATYQAMVDVCNLTADQQAQAATLDAAFRRAVADFKAANADQIAAADHDRGLASDISPCGQDELDDSLRGARNKACLVPLEQLAHVHRVQTVNVFPGVNFIQHSPLVQAGRQRDLDQYPVD